MARTKISLATQVEDQLPPANIAQDASNRFTTDTEKSTWNGKAGTAVATTGADGLMSSTDKAKLNGVEANANNYTHPSTHSLDDITETTTKKILTDADYTVSGKTITFLSAPLTGQKIIIDYIPS